MSRSAKQRIAKHSEDKVDSTTQDVDRQLLEIRRALTNEHGADFNFYEQKLIEHDGSRTQASGGGLFTEGEKFRRQPNFDEQERDYKLEIASKIEIARDAQASACGDSSGAPE